MSSGLFGQPAATNPQAGTQPAGGLGLFGQPSQKAPAPASGGGLFGQQPSGASSTQPKSIFGGNFAAGGATTQASSSQQTQLNFGQTPPAAGTAAPSLFGAPVASKPQVSVSLGAFGTQPQGAQGQTGQQTSLFGQPQTTTTPGATPSLFGQPQTPFQGGTSFMGVGAKPPVMPSPAPGMGFMQPTQQQQFQNAGAPLLLSKDQRHQEELFNILQTYKKAMDTHGDKNRFRGCLYNKINPESMSQTQLQALAQQVPTQIGGVPVDLCKWTKVVEENPSKRKLVPTQVSSTSELKQRLTATLKAMKTAKERLSKAKEHLALVSKECDSEVKTSLKTVNEKNELIRSRLANVFGKFEAVLTQQGRIMTEKGPQEDLISRQNALLTRLIDPQHGLLHKAERARQQNHEALTISEHFRGSDTFDGKFDGKELDKQQVRDADMREILRVLQSQKQGIEILQKSVQSTASQLNVMDKELNL